jgi:hypothetical protein
MLTPKEIYMCNVYNQYASLAYGCDSNYNQNTIIENRFMINECCNIPNDPCLNSCVPPTIITIGRTADGVQPIILTVSETGTLPMKHQWYKDGVYIPSATGSSYTIPNSVLAPNGIYKVAVYNQCGTVISSDLVVGPTAGIPPSIATQPSTLIITEGSSITLSVVATGTAPLTYQWKKNGADILGATSSSYVQSGSITTDSGSYTVVVTNAYGTVTSNTATVTVNIAGTPPVITLQPTSNTGVTAGLDITLTTTATGALTYQWYKNATPISGATSTSYVLTNVQTGSAGAYTVVATNSFGSTTSNVANIGLASCPVPVITSQPSGQTINVGGTVTFSVTATGATSYQWKKGGVNISGATTSSYNIPTLIVGDAATYSVDVTNSCGTVTSNAAALVVNCPVPVITGQPTTQTLNVGGNVTFSVSATGATSYQWKKAGVNISGATTSSYSITGLISGDASAYTVDVTNACGTVTSTAATLVVNCPVPVITSQPSGASLALAGTTTLSVTATGAISYQWRKNGTNISGAITSSYNIASAIVGDAGAYTVVVTNACGSVTSSTANITVNCPVPVITSQPSYTTIDTGAILNLSVTGTGVTSYQWYKDSIAVSGQTSSTLSITGATVSNNGIYTVVLTNSCGNVTSSSVTVAINCPSPVITIQPTASTTVSAGATVALSVSFTSASTVTFQWKKDGVNISGATTSALNLPSVTTGDAGTYSVVLTNACGLSNSSNAVVTVNAVTTYDSIMTFPASTFSNAGDNAKGVTGQTAAANAIIKFEFNNYVGTPVQLPVTMNIYVGATLQMVVSYRGEYAGATFRFTSLAGVVYNNQIFSAGNKVL